MSMIEAATVGVRVTADSSSATRAMRSLRDELNDVARSASGWGASMRRIAETATGVLIGNAIPKLIGGFANLAREGLQAVTAHEQLSLAMENLAKRDLLAADATLSNADAQKRAAQASKELLGWTEQLAIKSPFESEGIQAALKTALAYGFVTDQAANLQVETGKLTQAQRDGLVTAQRLTQAMVDYAAGAGLSPDVMNSVANALGQIQAKGKLAGQEMLQLTNAGLNVRDMLAKSLGVSVQQVADMIERGQIDATTAISAITTSLEKDFGGAAARTTNTFSGLLSSLGEFKTIGLREFFTGTFEAIQPYLTKFVEMLSNPATMEAIRGIGQALGDKVAGALQRIGELVSSFQTGGFSGLLGALGLSDTAVSIIEKVSGSISSLGGFLSNTIQPVLADLGEQIMPAIQSALEFVNEYWDAFKGALEGVAAVLVGGGVVAAIAGIAGTLLSLVNPVTLLIGLAAGLGMAWESNFGGIRDKVLPVIEALKGGFNDLVAFFQGDKMTGPLAQWQGKLEEIVTKAKELWGKLVDFFTPTIERLQTAWGQMIESLAPLGAKLQELWTAAEPVLSTLAAIVGGVLVGGFNLLMEVVAAVMPSIGGIISNAIDIAITVFNTLRSTFEELVAIVKGLIAGDWSAAWEHAKALFAGLWDGIKTIATEIWNTVQTLFGDLLTGIGNWLGNINEEAKSKWEEFWQNIEDKLKGVYDSVSTWINDALDFLRNLDLAQIGKDMITGLADGIWERAITYLKEKAEAVANLLPDWVKQILGIASPSRVFYEIGLEIVAGMVEALKDKSPEAVTAMSQFLGAIGGVIDAIGKAAEWRPVIDLRERMQALVVEIQTVVTVLSQLYWWSRNLGWLAEHVADTMQAVGTIASGLQSMAESLATVGKFVTPEKLKEKVTQLVTAMQEAVTQFAKVNVQGLSDIATKAGMMGYIGSALAGLAEAWTVIGQTNIGQVDVKRIVTWLVDLAGEMATAMTALQASAKFTFADTFKTFVDNLMKTMEPIRAAMDVAAQMAAFKWPTVNAADLIAWLKTVTGMIGQAVLQLLSSKRWQLQFPKEFETLAANLAAAFGPLSTALDFAQKLGGFKWPGVNVASVVAWLKAVSGMVGQAVVELEQSKRWTLDFPKSFREFVDNLVAGFAPLSTALDFTQKLATFKFPGVQVEGIVAWLKAVSGMVGQAVVELEKSRKWALDFPKGFQEFVDNLVAGFAPLSAALDFAQKLATFKWPGVNVAGIVAWLKAVSGMVGQAVVELEKSRKWTLNFPKGFQEFVDNLVAGFAPLSAALDFAQKLATFKWPANPAGEVLPYLKMLAAMATQMVRELQGTDLGNLGEAFVAFAGRLQAAFGPMAAAIDFAGKLSTFKQPKLAIDGALDTLKTLATKVAQTVRDIKADPLLGKIDEVFAKFAGNLQAAFGPMAAAVDFLEKLRMWRAMPNLETRFARFRRAWEYIIEEFHKTYKAVGNLVDEELRKFAAALGEIAQGLGAALDLLSRDLDKLQTPIETLWTPFTVWTQATFSYFADWLKNPDTALGQDEIELTGAFAGALSSLMGGLKSALELALALPGQWSAPNETVWNPFVAWVQSVFDTFYQWLNTVAEVSAQETTPKYTEGGLGIVGAFASALSSLMGGLKSALELALALPGQWPVLTEAGWKPFFDWVQQTFDNFANYVSATYPSTPEATHDFGPVQAFGEAMNAIFGGLKSALDVLGNLHTYIGPTQAKLDKFLADVESMMSRLATFASTTLTAEQLDITGKFGDAMSKLVSGLSSALDLFKTLANTDASVYTDSDLFGDRVGLLIASVHNTLMAFKTYVEAQVGATWIPVAEQFHAAISTVFDLLSSALTLFTDLAGAHLPTTERLTGFVDEVLRVFGAVTTGLATILSSLEPVGVQIANWFAEFASGELNTAAGQWYSAGKNVGHSLGQGVLSELDYLSWAGGQAGQALLDAMKEALGIASPSQEMVDIANNLGTTLAGQLERNVGRVAAAGERMAAALLPGATTPTMAFAYAGLPDQHVRVTHDVRVISPDGSVDRISMDDLAERITSIIRWRH